VGQLAQPAVKVVVHRVLNFVDPNVHTAQNFIVIHPVATAEVVLDLDLVLHRLAAAAAVEAIVHVTNVIKNA
jgi:hypothetical protein